MEVLARGPNAEKRKPRSVLGTGGAFAPGSGILDRLALALDLDLRRRVVPCRSAPRIWEQMKRERQMAQGATNVGTRGNSGKADGPFDAGVEDGVHVTGSLGGKTSMNNGYHGHSPADKRNLWFGTRILRKTAHDELKSVGGFRQAAPRQPVI